jgi:hypothetical protein
VWRGGTAAAPAAAAALRDVKWLLLVPTPQQQFASTEILAQSTDPTAPATHLAGAIAHGCAVLLSLLQPFSRTPAGHLLFSGWHMFVFAPYMRGRHASEGDEQHPSRLVRPFVKDCYLMNSHRRSIFCRTTCCSASSLLHVCSCMCAAGT